MILTGIEIVNMDEGEIRAVECKCSKNSVKLINGVQASFEKPFMHIKSRELVRLLKHSQMRSKYILLILPDSICQSKLWEGEMNPTNKGGASWNVRSRHAYIPATFSPQGENSKADRQVHAKDALHLIRNYVEDNKYELGIDNDMVVKKSYTGTVDSICYGIITKASHEALDGINRVFDCFNLKYSLPSVTAYSVLKFETNTDYSGILDLKERSLTFAVYHKRVLVWLSNFPYTDDTSVHETDISAVHEAAVRALNIARGNRLYPSKIFLAGVMANTNDIDMTLSRRLETDCELYKFSQSGMTAGAELSTLIGVMRGLFLCK